MTNLPSPTRRHLEEVWANAGQEPHQARMLQVVWAAVREKVDTSGKLGRLTTSVQKHARGCTPCASVCATPQKHEWHACNALTSCSTVAMG